MVCSLFTGHCSGLWGYNTNKKEMNPAFRELAQGIMGPLIRSQKDTHSPTRKRCLDKCMLGIFIVVLHRRVLNTK